VVEAVFDRFDPNDTGVTWVGHVENTPLSTVTLVMGGGLIAVSPGNFGIAVISPPLDEAGNSVRAQKAITDISAALGGNPYAAGRTATAAGRVGPPR